MISLERKTAFGTSDVYEFARERAREQAVGDMKIYLLFHQRGTNKLVKSAALNEQYALSMRVRSERRSRRIDEPLPRVIAEATYAAYDELWDAEAIEPGQTLHCPADLAEYVDEYPEDVRMIYGFSPRPSPSDDQNAPADR